MKITKENLKKFMVRVAIRAIKTFCQTFLAAIPTTAAFIGSVNWQAVLSSAGLAAILSVVTSFATPGDVMAGQIRAKEGEEDGK